MDKTNSSGDKVKLKLLRLALSAVALVHANTFAQAPIVIKFSYVVPADTPKGKAIAHFKELAEKATRDRVQIEVYPNSTLYKDKEELEALQLGAVQMLAPSLAKFSPMGIKEFEVFDLPYIFPDRDAVHRVTEGEVGRSLFKKLERKGIVGLAYWDNGLKLMSANRPLQAPADFRGLKMGIQSSKALKVQMRALGAHPQVEAFPETYQALKTGMIDGTESSPSSFYAQKMHEVQKHVTLSSHGYLGYAVIVNKKFWDGLPADIRTALEGAMRDATRYANVIAQRENDEALDAMRRSGKTSVYVLSDREKTTWKQALAPVQKELETRIGKDLIDAVRREATGSARGK